MKKIVAVIGLLFLSANFVNAQYSLNDYKYVIVEKQFHFQNEENEYGLNGLVRFLLRKHGFIAIIQGETLPDDMLKDYCLALTSELKIKGTLRTRAQITLRDCKNNVVFTSVEGVTKEKSFARAYDIAIRNTFESFEGLNYKYIPKEDTTTESVVKETKAVEKELTNKPSAATVDLKKEEVQNDVNPSDQTKPVIEPNKESTVEAIEVYYSAKANSNGYDLQNSFSKNVDYSIYQTSLNDVYLIKGMSGIIFKKGSSWIHEYRDGDKKIVKELKIKF